MISMQTHKPIDGAFIRQMDALPPEHLRLQLLLFSPPASVYQLELDPLLARVEQTAQAEARFHNRKARCQPLALRRSCCNRGR